MISQYIDSYLNASELQTIKLLEQMQPALYKKLMRIGLIGCCIGEFFKVDNPEFFKACFFANIGLLAMLDIYNDPKLISNLQRETIKRHPMLSAEFLRSLGHDEAAEFAKYHHELPNAQGYYRQAKYPIESNFIHIADMFDGLISDKPYRPPYSLDEALEFTMQHYRDGRVIARDKIKPVEEILTELYYKLKASI